MPLCARTARHHLTLREVFSERDPGLHEEVGAGIPDSESMVSTSGKLSAQIQKKSAFE